MTEGVGFARAISPVEWLYVASQEWAPPLAIQLCVEGRGELTRDALQAAVDRAAAACPGASLRRRGGRWVATGVAPDVRELPPLDRDQPGLTPFDALCAHPLARRPLRGPCAEVLFWPGAPARILFRVAHAAMDGAGCLVWAKQVFACLRAADPTPHCDPTTDWDLFQAAGGGSTASQPLEAPAPFAARGPFLAFPLIRRVVLPPGQPALVAKLGALLAAEAHAPRLRLMVPIDLRRHRPGLGSCANLALPIFLDVAGSERWAELQGRLLRAMQANEELDRYALPALKGLPEAVVGGALWASGLACHLSGRYLASALLSHLGRVPLADLSAPGFEALTVYSLPVHTPIVPLTVVMLETDHGTELTVAASLGRDQAGELDAWLGRVAAALGPAPAAPAPAAPAVPVTAAPAAPASATPAPPARLIAGPPSLVGPPGAAPGVEGVWAAIARQAQAAPNAPAVLYQGTTTSYRELVAGCDALAAGCHRHGLRPGDRVAVVVERDAASLGLLLACLRLGATFVPIDAAQPAARIARIVAESGARCCLVGRAETQATLAPVMACEVVEAAALRAAGAGPVLPPSEPPAAGAGPVPPLPEAAADPVPPPPELPEADVYVIYTSGSTSAPKGVPIAQRNLMSYLLWARAAYGVAAPTRFGLISSMAFDLAITAWLLPLVAGGSVAIMDEPVWPDALQRFVASTAVTALKLAPAHLAIVNALPPEWRPAVQLVVVGGAQLFEGDAAAAQRRFGPACALFNEYGPTEATVGCIVHRYDGAAPADGGGVVPIGRPIAGTDLLLRGTPDAGDGVYELLLRGDGVSRGYLAAPAGGGDAFERLADGTVAYRTGDRVRVLADGALAFWGRQGDALKVNGYRVDRNELVDALRALPGVVAAHVVAGPHGPDERLTAYLACAPGADPGDPRALLLAQLPPYMVPHAFRRVDALPLTANGKVDEAALAQAPFTPLTLCPDHVALTAEPVALTADPVALSAGQARVAAIWQRVLALPNLPAAQAQFYALGGDSLALLRVLSALDALLADATQRAAFNASVPALLGQPTVAGMAAAVARASGAAAQP